MKLTFFKNLEWSELVSLKRRKYIKKKRSDSFQIEKWILITPKLSKTFLASFHVKFKCYLHISFFPLLHGTLNVLTSNVFFYSLRELFIFWCLTLSAMKQKTFWVQLDKNSHYKSFFFLLLSSTSSSFLVVPIIVLLFSLGGVFFNTSKGLRKRLKWLLVWYNGVIAVFSSEFQMAVKVY